MSNENKTIQVTCPCCDAMLTIDPMLAVVLDHKMPVEPQMAVNLKDAVNQVKGEAGRRDEKFNSSPKRRKTNRKSSKQSFKNCSKKPKTNRSPNR